MSRFWVAGAAANSFWCFHTSRLRRDYGGQVPRLTLIYGNRFLAAAIICRGRELRGLAPLYGDEHFPMPAEYSIDKDRRLVLSTASGVLTEKDLLDLVARLRNDPDFSPEYRELFDFTAVSHFDLSQNQILALVREDVFALSARRAFVVTSDLGYGILRMVQSHRAVKGDEGIRIFRDRPSALAWLKAPKGVTRYPFP